ncbi:MAG: pyridoxamine 5'-phosphate oxidase family protein, partial [Gemmatimonadetes bacterium]
YHSVNYRSVVCFARGAPRLDRSQTTAVLEAMIARYFPGRRAGRDYDEPLPRDIDGTSVIALEIDEWSAKARRGGPTGPRDNQPDAPGTAGVIDLRCP